MNLSSMLKQLDAEEIEGMLAEALAQLRSPAKYLDAALTAKPSTGVELYERYDNLCERLRKDFPDISADIPARRYRATCDGSLLRRDLSALIHNLETILKLIA